MVMAVAAEAVPLAAGPTAGLAAIEDAISSPRRAPTSRMTRVTSMAIAGSQGHCYM